MSVERDIIDELDVVLANIRRAEQNIIGKDSSDKLKVVNRLVDLEETVKSIKNDYYSNTWYNRRYSYRRIAERKTVIRESG